VLKKFLRWAQNEFDAKVKKIRSDNGIEFKNTQKTSLMKKASSMSFRLPIPHNKKWWPKGRIILS
jgi:hypothetical protein